MCGRFFIPEMDDAPEELALMLQELEQRLQRTSPETRIKRGEILPGDMAAVIAPSRSRQPMAFLMQWGFRLNNRLVFNARSETAQAKPMFAAGMKERRCLIPATAYFEWNRHVPGKPKYRFSFHEDKLFYMAGIYRYEENKKPVFTVLTRDAAEHIAQIHDRMPVILPSHLAQAWLDADTDPQMILKHVVEDVLLAPEKQ